MAEHGRSCEVAKLRSCEVAKLRSCEVAKLRSCEVAKCLYWVIDLMFLRFGNINDNSTMIKRKKQTNKSLTYRIQKHIFY